MQSRQKIINASRKFDEKILIPYQPIEPCAISRNAACTPLRVQPSRTLLIQTLQGGLMSNPIQKPHEPKELSKESQKEFGEDLTFESTHHPSQEKPEGGPEGLEKKEETQAGHEGRPFERTKLEGERRPRGTAAMDPQTRREVARKGGLAVSRNRQHMAEIGKKGGQTVSKNRDHMATIGRKGGEASRGHH